MEYSAEKMVIQKNREEMKLIPFNSARYSGSCLNPMIEIKNL